MKKVILFLALAGMAVLQSCTKEEYYVQDDSYDSDTISEVFELRNVDFSYDVNTGGYSIYRVLSPQIYSSDVILIYRMSGLIDSNTPIWQLIPRTLYLDEGELDYDYDFSQEDFVIYAGGTYNLEATPEYIYNQTFRVVIVPGYFSNKIANTIDYSDYNAVIQHYNIDDSNVKQIN